MSPSTSPPQLKTFNIHYPAQYVAHVEINRAEKLNSFTEPMFYELKAIFEYLSLNPEVRAILISGAGEKAFTAGLDVAAASSPDNSLNQTTFGDAARRANHLRRHIDGLQATVTAVALCEKPTICLLHGYSFGLAIDLSTACDIRLCAPNTKFCVKEVDVGLAADIGTLARLPKVCGTTSWVKEICITARPFDAEEALHNRLVSRVVSGSKKELIDEGLKLAKLIATKSPVAVVGTKNILDAAWGRTVEDNLTYTAVWNAAMLQSEDTKQAMAGSLQRKTPTFEKL